MKYVSFRKTKLNQPEKKTDLFFNRIEKNILTLAFKSVVVLSQ